MNVLKLSVLIAIVCISTGCLSQESNRIIYKTVPVFSAWVLSENLPDLDHWDLTAKYDLLFHDTWPLIHVGYDQAEALPYRGLITKLHKESIVEGLKKKEALQKINPDITLLGYLDYREGNFKNFENEGENWWEKGFFPPDSKYWLTDNQGNKIIGWGEDTNLNGRIDDQDKILTYLVDFINPEVQNLVAERAKSMYESGVFDGVFFDWMAENSTTDNAAVDGWNPLLSNEVELQARIDLLKKVREKTAEDFIIMGNTNWGIKSQLVPLMNAVFMECYKGPYNDPYPEDQLQITQDAVIYNQNNLAAPAIVCLEGWRICYEYNPDKLTRIEERNTPENLQMMRFFPP